MRKHIVGSNEHHLPFAAWFWRHLSSSVPGTPQAAVASGRFFHNGKALTDTKTVLTAGDEILDLVAGEAVIRKTSDLSIVYEDADILIVDKPAGMLSHPEAGMRDRDVLSVLRLIRDAAGYAPGNRLDFNTSGLMIVTKSSAAAAILSAASREDRIRKIYLAAVSGSMSVPEATIRAFLLKDEAGAVVRVAATPIPGAKPIVTRYRVAHERGDLSLLEIEPVTGRTHQIRAHMAFCGHPVVGDPLYGNVALNHRYGLKSQALTAYRLSFSFPESEHPWHRLEGKTFMKKDVEFLDVLGLRQP